MEIWIQEINPKDDQSYYLKNGTFKFIPRVGECLQLEGVSDLLKVLDVTYSYPDNIIDITVEKQTI